MATQRLQTIDYTKYNKSLVGMVFWNIKDDKTGQFNQYTTLNFLTEFTEPSDNLFGNDLQKLDTKADYFHYLRSMDFNPRNPLPCRFEMGTARAAKRKSKPFATDIEIAGQDKPLSAKALDLVKMMDIAPHTLSELTPFEELQAAMTLAEKVDYNLVDVRLVPLRISFIEKYQFETDDKELIESAHAYVCSYNHSLNTENFIGLLTAKISANPNLVPKLKQMVNPNDIHLKFFECIGVCYPKVGSKEADTMHLADIFYQGTFIIRSGATQKKR